VGYETDFPLEAGGRWYNWPSDDYDSLTVADISTSLTQVFMGRNPHLNTTGINSDKF